MYVCVCVWSVREHVRGDHVCMSVLCMSSCDHVCACSLFEKSQSCHKLIKPSARRHQLQDNIACQVSSPCDILPLGSRIPAGSQSHHRGDLMNDSSTDDCKEL